VISGVLTLFHWTLRMDSRSIYPHLIRVAFAFAMLFAMSMAFADFFGTSRVGLRYFESVCALNVVLITVSGISYFVTAVTEEKDAGTYALLRLAGMNSLSITLGKSTSRLVSSLMLLIIQVPFTFLAVTLGGILWQQVVAAYLALAAWMAFVANLALFCSVRCSTSGRAAGLSGVLILLLFSLPVLIGDAILVIPAGVLPAGTIGWLETAADAIHSLSVVQRLNEVLNVSGTLVLFDDQFWILTGSAIGLFVLSTVTLDFWSAPTENGDLPTNSTVRRWLVRRPRLMPIAWKEYVYFTGGHGFFLAKFAAGGLLYVGYQLLQLDAGREISWELSSDVGWNLFLTYAVIIYIELLLYSSGCLFYELRQSTQSTLGTLPISTNRVLLEKLAGCVVSLVPMVFWLILTIIMGYRGVSRYCSLTMVVSYLIMLGFSTHVAALLSLYTRWAALPLTILSTFPAFFCLALPIYGFTSVTMAAAGTHGLPVGSALVILVNLFWTWLFVLLPIEIGIRDRWTAVVRQ
jgi:hypothetical protein